MVPISATAALAGLALVAGSLVPAPSPSLYVTPGATAPVHSVSSVASGVKTCAIVPNVPMFKQCRGEYPAHVHAVQSKVVLVKGQSIALQATVYTAWGSDEGKEWKIVSNSNPAAATLSKSGRITAHRKGRAVIVLRPVNDQAVMGPPSSNTEVTVVVLPVEPPKSRKLTSVFCPGYLKDGSRTLEVENHLLLSCKARPARVPKTKIYFKTSDPAVATVDANGLVLGISAGKVAIKVVAKSPSGGRVVKKYRLTVISSGHFPTPPQ